MSDSQLQMMRNQESESSTSYAYNNTVAPSYVQEFNDVQTVFQQVKDLCKNTSCSDVTIVVEDKRFPAHKTILACRSEYFRAMFFGGLREGHEPEVELHDTPAAAFEILLSYFYSGILRFNNLKLDLLLDVFSLVHQYGISKLEDAMCDYLKHILNSNTVAIIYATAHLFSLEKLCDDCLEFMDKCAKEVLSSDAFLQLPGTSLLRILCRTSFVAKELLIFQTLAKWINCHPEEEALFDELLMNVRLSLIKLEDLLNEVRASGLVKPDRLLDTINDQTHKKTSELGYRGFKKHNVNVALSSLDACLVEGNPGQAVLKQEQDIRDLDKCISHDDGGSIIIELGQLYIINHIDMVMVDKDQRCYSYYIEISMDKEDWVRVIDYSAYLCKGRQKLYFPERVVRYIRIVCTHSSVHKTFYISAFKAMYSTDQVVIYPGTDIVEPTINVTTVAQNAFVLEGVSRSRNALINGVTHGYDWDDGYTCHQLNNGCIIIQLPQPYMVGSMRLLLWDCDDRTYSFYIEVSDDNEEYMRVIEGHNLSSWQTFYFKPLPVVYIRIIGTSNSANEVFHCVHFECPLDPDNQVRHALAEPTDVNVYPVQYGKLTPTDSLDLPQVVVHDEV